MNRHKVLLGIGLLQSFTHDLKIILMKKFICILVIISASYPSFSQKSNTLTDFYKSEWRDFKDFINPHSLEIIPQAYIEPQLLNELPGATFQFIRNGYFCVDKDSKPGALVFNRTVTLKDSFKK